MDLEKMNRDDLLKRSKGHFFSTGMGDGASVLCRVNMKYGLAKIHLMQEQFGLEPNATFVSTPDETVTRNISRWKAGFGYGGKLTWGSGNDKIIILDGKPNACGMLVGGIDEIPDPKILIERIHDVKKDLFIDDIKIEWDMYKGNHFIDVFELVTRSAKLNLPKYVFIMHGSVSELRAETDKGPGLYWDKSNILKDLSQKVETKFGVLHILQDTDAKNYFDFFQYADIFAKEKRRVAAHEIFGNFQEICNVTHQGLLNMNELILGCQNIKDKDAKVFPIALKADLSAFLMRGIPNMDPEVIETMGFTKRAEKYGIMDRLLNANLMPHGAGYAFKDFINVSEVMEIKNNRYFILDMYNDIGTKICSDVREMEFDYRGKSVVLKTVELKFGEIMARLIPNYVLKI
ncbi:MAG: hypothetical protein EU548_00420 [Promethearchaeota archaeon]|nr:MAG: hypothetical protein EU548_00420 [Candidatus Lokiarchaeota archaeon]